MSLRKSENDGDNVTRTWKLFYIYTSLHLPNLIIAIDQDFKRLPQRIPLVLRTENIELL